MHALRRRVLVCSGSAPLRASLCACLASQPDLEVVGSCAGSDEILRQADAQAPDVILVDLSPPGRWQAAILHRIRNGVPQGRILATTNCTADEMVRAVLRAEWDGFIAAQDPLDDLLRAVRDIPRGRKFVSSSLSAAWSADVPVGGTHRQGGVARSAGDASPWDRLTLQEGNILRLIAQGYTNRAAAAHLRVSAKTVEKHRANLMRKLGLRDATALAEFLRERGLLDSLH
ncbi:two component transcriptional regulator, LuxR family [Burkholderiales bacterium GJ-E10]|nr:two component transcriptional regulator, LuxR family [Burkholderiales bacterium GJ-E10]